MFDKFGEFDSYEEINRAAVAQLQEGDHEAIKILAKENGIDVEDAQDYIDGYAEQLCNAKMAAVGKLKLEAEDLQLKGILLDWNGYITEQVMESKELCLAVRKKDKHLQNCMVALIKFAFENKVQVSDQIVKACMVNHNGHEEQMRSPLYLGIPSKVDCKRLIREYYLG